MRTVTLDPAGAVSTPTVSPSPGTSRLYGAGRRLKLSSDVFHLYLLIGAELVLMAALRAWSRNHHGG